MNLFLLVGIEVERLSFKMYHIIYNLYEMYIMSNDLEESHAILPPVLLNENHYNSYSSIGREWSCNLTFCFFLYGSLSSLGNQRCLLNIRSPHGPRVRFPKLPPSLMPYWCNWKTRCSQKANVLGSTPRQGTTVNQKLLTL